MLPCSRHTPCAVTGLEHTDLVKLADGTRRVPATEELIPNASREVISDPILSDCAC